MNLDGMNLDPDNMEGMGTESMMNLLAAMVVNVKLLDLDRRLIDSLKSRFPSDAANIDLNWVNRYVAAVYTLGVGADLRMIMLLGGPLMLARVMVESPDNKYSIERLTEKLQSGFNQYSMNMGQAVNADMVLKVAKLLTDDWLHSDHLDDLEQMKMDTHFYFHAVLVTDADVDMEKVRRDAYNHVQNLPPDERADLPPELLKIMDDWKADADTE